MTKYEILLGCDKLESKVLDDGARLYCPAIHIAPHAWLHAFYKWLSEAEMQTFQESLPCHGSNLIWDYLREFNGLRIFSGEIWVGGLRKRYGRKLADVWQPFSLVNLNTCERPYGLSQGCHVFGGYENDGLLVYFDRSAKVHLCRSTDSTSLFKWNSIDDFLSSEIIRIGKYYSVAGVKMSTENVTSELL